jgi:hypothetical protein
MEPRRLLRWSHLDLRRIETRCINQSSILVRPMHGHCEGSVTACVPGHVSEMLSLQLDNCLDFDIVARGTSAPLKD